MKTASAAQLSSMTAVVRAADGVRFVATADSRSALTRRLAEYVRERAPLTLWPIQAAEVRALLEEDEPDAAVARYFATVGDRWDEEWLDDAP